MFIVNKTDDIQRTRVNGLKTEVKPWEIVEVSEREWIYVTKAYKDIFAVSEEAAKRKEAPKKKKAPKKED